MTQEEASLNLSIGHSEGWWKHNSVILSKARPRELPQRETLRSIQCWKKEVLFSSMSVTVDPRKKGG